MVAEEDVRERLEAVRVTAGHVDGDGVLVADVLGERLAGRTVEDHHAGRPAHADEQIVLAPLVVVQAPHDARAREREVRLDHPLRKSAVAADLAEPPALVGVHVQRYPHDPVDHGELRPQ